MMYNFSLQNRPKFRKVYHFCYISFLATNQGEKLGVILEMISNKTRYKFHILIRYRYGFIIFGSYGL
jgi:hypothetical protein